MILEDENGNVVPIPPMGPPRSTYGQLQASLLDSINWGDWHDDLEMDEYTTRVVCERTKMTPELWETKNETERIPWLEQAIANSPLPVDVKATTGPERPAELPQYVTRDQIGALNGRHVDTVAKWFNSDDNAPKASVEGGGGTAFEYLWTDELRVWLKGKSGRDQPDRFPLDRFPKKTRVN
jgi:hypothetical protein